MKKSFAELEELFANGVGKYNKSLLRSAPAKIKAYTQAYHKATTVYMPSQAFESSKFIPNNFESNLIPLQVKATTVTRRAPSTSPKRARKNLPRLKGRAQKKMAASPRPKERKVRSRRIKSTKKSSKTLTAMISNDP